VKLISFSWMEFGFSEDLPGAAATASRKVSGRLLDSFKMEF
jgi:hypothetical protein